MLKAATEVMISPVDRDHVQNITKVFGTPPPRTCREHHVRNSVNYPPAPKKIAINIQNGQ